MLPHSFLAALPISALGQSVAKQESDDPESAVLQGSPDHMMRLQLGSTDAAQLQPAAGTNCVSHNPSRRLQPHPVHPEADTQNVGETISAIFYPSSEVALELRLGI